LIKEKTIFMKISFNWLKEYIQFDLTPEEICKYLTDCGLEVEGMEEFEHVKGGLKGLVIGEVMSCEEHPDSDHLHLTTVNIGNDTLLPVVCGAPNVAKGQKVIVATVGTVLYSGDDSFTIKKSKIRGAVSEGMICAEDEIGLGTSHDGIMVLDENAVPGILAADYFKIVKDYIIEIGLTPNRNDAMSHFGVARDLHAVLTIHQIPSTLRIPQCENPVLNGKKNLIDITIENKTDCPRYTGLTFENVEVKESPDWLKNRLRSIGIRPINNIVDITQFIMFEMGQPLHAFDADYIRGKKVIIKNLPEGTPFVTLDGNEIKLSSEDLMICNEMDGMCVAGVYGGLHSGVTAKTKNIFLESAYFKPKTVRKTSKRHNLKTDASFRFERGCDPDITVFAIKRAANLIQELAKASITSEIIDVYPTPIEPAKIKLAFAELDMIAGKEIDKNIVTTILLLLGMEVHKIGDEQLMVTVPPSRLDITSSVDLIEEVLRIYGYNNIEIPDTVQYKIGNHSTAENKYKNKISSFLVHHGFFEVINNSLTKSSYAEKFDFIHEKETVKLLNPLSSELNAMRQTLLFSGLENIACNINNKNSNLRLFEFGRTYKKTFENQSNNVTERFQENNFLSLFVTGYDSENLWNHKPVLLDIYYLKNIVFNMLKTMNFPIEELNMTLLSDSVFLTGFQFEQKEKLFMKIGEVHPLLLKSLDIKKKVYYAEIDVPQLYAICSTQPVDFKQIPVYPEVKRDLALVIDENINYCKLEEIACKYASKLLKKVSLFDVYEGDKIEKGKKSYALSFILQHSEKTLTEDDINKTMNKLIKAYEQEIGAILR
jgi:phenylalanyl-tRNA synthetase beta chain